MHNPTHPGETLQYIWPEGLSLTAGAKQLGISRSVVASLMNGDIRMTPAIADKLHNWGGISADQWLRLQIAHDQWLARRHSRTNEINFQLAA
jgi:addiction module HigA family antidote